MLQNMKRVIIIGASSGIGKELARIFASNGYEVGIAARRTDLLNELEAELPTKVFVSSVDVSNSLAAIQSLTKLIRDMTEVDIIIICAGTGYLNPSLAWSQEKATIDTNVTGFTAMAGVAMCYFVKKKSGHLVGISSIAGIKGSNICPSYNASRLLFPTILKGYGRRLSKKN